MADESHSQAPAKPRIGPFSSDTHEGIEIECLPDSKRWQQGLFVYRVRDSIDYQVSFDHLARFLDSFALLGRALSPLSRVPSRPEFFLPARRRGRRFPRPIQPARARARAPQLRACRDCGIDGRFQLAWVEPIRAKRSNTPWPSCSGPGNRICGSPYVCVRTETETPS